MAEIQSLRNSLYSLDIYAAIDEGFLCMYALTNTFTGIPSCWSMIDMVLHDDVCMSFARLGAFFDIVWSLA